MTQQGIINLNAKGTYLAVMAAIPHFNVFNRQYPIFTFGHHISIRGDYSFPCMYHDVYFNTNPYLQRPNLDRKFKYMTHQGYAKSLERIQYEQDHPLRS